MIRSKSHALEQTLNSLPRPKRWPISLPLSHLTIARYFDSIINAGKLEPRMCDVFKEKLIYLFYGGVLYRTANKPTRNASELPIVFVFHPSLLRFVERYYPFDTGALAKRYYGEWSDILTPYAEGFKICGKGDYTVPSQMVYHLYQNNTRYLNGKLNNGIKNKPEPLPQLFDFLNADLSAYGVDHRQLAIEAHCKQAIPFDNALLWVGYPDIKTKKFSALFEKLYDQMAPAKPEFFAYPSHVVFAPNEIAAQLQTSAHNSVVKSYLSLPGRTK